MSSRPKSEAPRVLLVEDETDLQELLRYNLRREGMKVEIADTGEDALRQVHDDPPDLILLDLMLPRMDGLEVCRRLKRDPATAAIPIVMVTAKGEEADIVTGLELGADDYITKPFSPRVLLARVQAVLRRAAAAEHEPEAEQAAPVIHRGSMTIYPDRHEVRVDDQSIELTATEFKLLSLLAQRPGRVFTRQQIIERLHGGHSAVTDRSVDVQVVSLRRKLGAAADSIETIRGVGYRFRE